MFCYFLVRNILSRNHTAVNGFFSFFAWGTGKGGAGSGAAGRRQGGFWVRFSLRHPDRQGLVFAPCWDVRFWIASDGSDTIPCLFVCSRKKLNSRIPSLTCVPPLRFRLLLSPDFGGRLDEVGRLLTISNGEWQVMLSLLLLWGSRNIMSLYRRILL